MSADSSIMSGTVFEHATEPAYVMDPEQSRILAANDAGCELLGYTREELLETPIARIHPSELAELSELLDRVLRDGRASTIKLTCRTKNGTFLPTEISLHKLELEGRTRVLGLVQDRSEHRQPAPHLPAGEAHPADSPHSAVSATLASTKQRRESEHTVTAATTAKMQARGRVRVEHGAKRIRAYLGGELIADSSRPLLVWEKPYYPTYYFPAADVHVGLLTPDGRVAHSPSRGDAEIYSLRAGGQQRAGAALHYKQSPFDELGDTIRLDWSAMDAWFEEDEEVFTHARDPYTRVDILPSSRHVRVDVDGVTVAESTKPSLLFETGLPVRYYLPKTDVRMDLLVPTETSSHCPYKGQAEYWSVAVDETVHPDVAWSYRTPLPESQKIAGLICFYPERVDIYVDDQLVQ